MSITPFYKNVSPFNLQKGVRQGCSCSPHLFNLCIEVLACLIRANPNYKPIQLYGKDHHLSLFADDITLFISHPRTTLPTLLHIIKEFGSLLGYTINWDSLLKSNWDTKTQQLRHNIDFWNTLPISLIGRVNAIKMVMLPDSSTFFSKLDSIISSFVWSNKEARISKNHLCKDKVKGGLGLPQFRLYYWAANLRVFSLWRQSLSPDSTLTMTASWLQIEREACGPTSLLALLNNPRQS
uniref:Reverse transcriptase domain-containing protein n=1 Tax=Scophthalmus maximus TaxID=52904 RepID=A0A8D3BV72_SCOMX